MWKKSYSKDKEDGMVHFSECLMRNNANTAWDPNKAAGVVYFAECPCCKTKVAFEVNKIGHYDQRTPVVGWGWCDEYNDI